MATTASLLPRILSAAPRPPLLCSYSARGTRTVPFAFRFPKAIITSLSSSSPAANFRQDIAFPAQSSAVPNAQIDTSSLPRQPVTPPYNVFITGSTKGMGYALARVFLEVGDDLVICSRSGERAVLSSPLSGVQSAVEALRREFGGQRAWINNAVSNAYSYKPLAEASDEDLIEVVTTNTLDLMLCCREGFKMMLGQPRGGHVFNIDGAGSDGRPTPRFAAYGATKCSIIHLTESLQPGMVTTDLLMSGATTKQAKFFINVLADPAEVVAQYLVPNIRSVPINGSLKPTYIRFLTGIKTYKQIFSVL